MRGRRFTSGVFFYFFVVRMVFCGLLGLRVQGSGFMVEGLRFRAHGFGVWVLGFEFQGLGFRV